MTKSTKPRKLARKARPASHRNRDEAIHMALAGARAAVMTAALCLQGKGVYDDVGFIRFQHNARKLLQPQTPSQPLWWSFARFSAHRGDVHCEHFAVPADA